ncbi:MAG: hypothetical protein RQ745_11875 [Longimicrobiales bacterium]|nr:hypothetical protein [Longimicrobiales bacterium]
MILLATLTACVDSSAQEIPTMPTEGVSFVVFGDQPYIDADLAAFPGLVAEVNATGTPFVIHLGDIKRGGTACTDSVIVGRRELYRGFRAPVAFTPGDNEWADCHRGGDAPLERLAFLREAFYGAEGLPLPPGVVRQGGGEGPYAEFVENLRWVHRNVVFATAHVVGSDNGRDDFDDRTEADDAEVVRREAAVRAWVEETFDEARRIGADAVVIAEHADLRFDRAARSRQDPAFTHLLEPLEAGARAFDGPVLLLQGDLHSCFFDKPVFHRGEEPLDNFWRLRVSGGPMQTGWFMVNIRPDEPDAVRVAPRMLRGFCRL